MPGRRVRMGAWGLLCASLAAAAVLSAGAQPVPDEPPGVHIDRTFQEHRIGDRSLGDWLVDLDAQGCLLDEQETLVPGLTELRRVYSQSLDDHTSPAVWPVWQHKLRGCSEDGRGLVETWLDSPALARRKYLCEDGLPQEWNVLDQDTFVAHAVVRYDEEIARREESLHSGEGLQRESSVMELLELREALVNRYRMTYPDDAEHAAAYRQLDDRLALMWDELVEPHDLGFRPPPWAEVTPADAAALGRMPFRPPFIGTALHDPEYLFEAARITDGWAKHQHLLMRDLQSARAERRELVGFIAKTEDPREMARLERDALRLDADLDSLVADLAWLEDRVRHHTSGSRVVDGMLDDGFRRKRVRSLDERELRVLREQQNLATVIADAGERHAELVANAGGTGEKPGPGADGGPGPGNWLAGLPGADALSLAELPSPETDEGIEPSGTSLDGQGWVLRRYEGPLPVPPDSWDPLLVWSLRARHPDLDEVDARILLELIAIAFHELPDDAAVEQAVRDRLLSADGLQLLGKEGQLSGLLDPSAPPDEQPVVTFLLRLYF